MAENQKENGGLDGDVDPQLQVQQKDPNEEPLTEQKLKKMSKNDLLDAGLKLLQQKATLGTDVAVITADRDKLQKQNVTLTTNLTTLTADRDQLKITLDRVTGEKNTVMDELASTCVKLDHQNKVAEDLLQQLNLDAESDGPEKKRALLLMDHDRAAIEPLLADGTYNYTVTNEINKTQDINNLLENGHLDEMPNYDVVIISCGIGDIMDGSNGRLVAARLLGIAERIANTGVEVAILGLRPSQEKPGQVLLNNSRLGKLVQCDTTGIRFIHTEAMYQANNDKVLNDDNTLTPEGAQIMVSILNDIKTTGITRMKLDTDKAPHDKKKHDDDKKKNDDDDDEEDDGESSDDDDEVELKIKHHYMGPIIGKLGARIRALRAKTKATIYILDMRKEGKKRSIIRIRGHHDNVVHAQSEIDKIIREQKPSLPVSPLPKKLKR